MERAVVIILTLFLAGIFSHTWLTIGLIILAVGSNLTALQRLWSVHRFASEQQAQLHQMTSEVEKALTFTIDEGQTRYVRLSVGLGVIVYRVYPELKDESEALPEIQSLSYIGALK